MSKDPDAGDIALASPQVLSNPSLPFTVWGIQQNLLPFPRHRLIFG
jgi:hypothetical protein